jgi:hypothetical protein
VSLHEEEGVRADDGLDRTSIRSRVVVSRSIEESGHLAGSCSEA